MSYIDLPRLTFSGVFQADVNTVNNDVRNYDVETFEARFQTPQRPASDGKGVVYNGWWNPDGSNAFRLLGCKITGLVDAGGRPIAGIPEWQVDVQRDRVQAKIIDLDPQFQFASALWGMTIVIGVGGQSLMTGRLVPTPFRDIYFGRLVDETTGIPPAGSQSASARFTGTLEGVTFHETGSALEGLRAIAAANGDRLSLSLMTYGYSKTRTTDGLTFGSVIGSIGPWHAGDPLTFAPGRRFAPSPNPLATQPPFAAASGIGFMNAVVSPAGAPPILSVDFGNALPLLLRGQTGQPDQVISVRDLGPLHVVVLKEADPFVDGPDGIQTASCASDGDAVAPDRYVSAGVLEAYDMSWMNRTGGVADFALSPDAASLVGDHPIAVLVRSAGGGFETIAIRESVGGVWVRADDFVQRVDTAAEGWVSSSVTLYAMRYGRAYPDARIALSLMPPDDTEGGSYPDAVDSPQTTIPTINVPADKVSLPATTAADARGVATFVYQAQNPQNPRRYIDGQVYELAYTLAGSGLSPLPTFDVVGVHVRDAYTPPPAPSWSTDIRPILVQYSNLYPIMSRGLFSLADFDSVAQNARLLLLAFMRPERDPNYMPASRDMSAGKRRAIIDWLRSYLSVEAETYGALPVPPTGSTLSNPLRPLLTSRDHPLMLMARAMRPRVKSITGSGVPAGAPGPARAR